MIPTHIIGNIPCKVLGYDRLHVECHLNTIVLEGTYVLQQVITECGTCWYVNCCQQIGCLAIVTINVERETVVESSEVDTCIPCCGLFPSQLVVILVRTYSLVIVVTERILSIRVTYYIKWSIVEVIDTILLTSLTPTYTEFEIIKPFYIFQEALVVDLPGKGC